MGNGSEQQRTQFAAPARPDHDQRSVEVIGCRDDRIGGVVGAGDDLRCGIEAGGLGDLRAFAGDSLRGVISVCLVQSHRLDQLVPLQMSGNALERLAGVDDVGAVCSQQPGGVLDRVTRVGRPVVGDQDSLDGLHCRSPCLVRVASARGEGSGCACRLELLLVDGRSGRGRSAGHRFEAKAGTRRSR